MPRYLITLNQKSSGILFASRYYISAEQAAMLADVDALVLAQSEIQTTDVEYLNCLARNVDVQPNLVLDVPLTRHQGVNTGQTAPVANFLNIVFSSADGRRTSKRIRGFVVDDLTSDTVFSIQHSGDTDQLNPDSGGVGTQQPRSEYGSLLAEYCNVIVSKFASPTFSDIIGYSTRASIGSKQVKRTY